jgi:non-canonical poly(A) RNA polymerase PAPD5/7
MHPLVQTGQIRAEDNLGVLLMEALELYGRNFSYENVGIRIRGNGEYYSKVSHNEQIDGIILM